VTGDAAIRVRGLRKAYGEHEALRGVDLDVAAGEVVVLLGPNGAGKTSTLEILQGYRRRDGGDVEVLGVDPGTPSRAWRERIGIVPQEGELDRNYSVWETMILFMDLFRRPRFVGEVVARAGLEDVRFRKMRELDTAQRRRVDLAVGLIGDPAVLFVDEPTAHLDPAERTGVWTILNDLRELGRTVLVASQHMDEARALADRVVVLRDGLVVTSGTPGEVSRRAVPGGAAIRFTRPPDTGLDRITAAAGVAAVLVDGAVELRTDDLQNVLARLLGWADARGLRLEGLDIVRPEDERGLAIVAETPE
jgi:ABC-2 type transport system ATP-binding protein